MDKPVISLQNVVKSYGSFTLGPVDLEIEPGYVVAVVGPNGSGKSTLFRMLMGLARPDEGDVRVFGGRYPEDEVEVKQKIGYVPERSVGHDEMTANDLGRFVSHWYPSWNEEFYRDLVGRFEIEADKKFVRLSKGMQRRLSFVLAAATGSEMLLLDEPTEGVDPFARREMMAEISRHVQDGDRTVLFATHVMEEVRRIADYVAFLVNGDFLGLYEKDALIESWKTLWVDRPPGDAVPGVVTVEDGAPARIVTKSPEETTGALEEQRVSVIRTGAMDLEEILSHLMREKRKTAVGGRPEGTE